MCKVFASSTVNVCRSFIIFIAIKQTLIYIYTMKKFIYTGQQKQQQFPMHNLHWIN